MKKFLSILFAFVFVSLSSTQGQLITNGSFETPVAPTSPGYTTIYPGSEPAGFGWTVVGPNSVGSNGGVDNVLDSFGGGFSTPDPDQFLDLVGWSNSATGGHGIHQSFTTEIGKTYRLDFSYLGAQGGKTYKTDIDIWDGAYLGTSLVDIEFDISTTVASATFLDYATNNGSITFQAISTTTNLSFVTESPAGTNHGLYIDDVNVNVIPEPSTYALIFGGFALGIVAIRRKLGKREVSA